MNYGHGGPDPRVDGQSLIEDLLLDKVQAASGLFQWVCLQRGVLETGRNGLLHGLLIGLGPHKGGGGLTLISASRVHDTPVVAPLEGGWRSGMLG